MITAQLHIGQRQITVQIQEYEPKPIEVPLPLGGSYNQPSFKAKRRFLSWVMARIRSILEIEYTISRPDSSIALI